ncbi:zinc finger protein ZOP1 [Typha latifolia]|uniref:zinc finger protein ZOP1 n=1 Tax=Typha latifolia TaxID=4733 RepID=UPI003C2EEC0F
MTEYWVSQGNKWCDFCKIYIANNPLSIRTHELGQRHKDSVAKKLATMRKESSAREKEQKEAARALEQIEAKAQRSYQKDLASFKEAAESSGHSSESSQRSAEGAKNLGNCGAGKSAAQEEALKGVAPKRKGPAPGLVISTSLNPTRAIKGAPSSIAVNKRKREDTKTKAVSKEEEAALKAREAARKRMEEREKPLMGLYRSY